MSARTRLLFLALAGAVLLLLLYRVRVVLTPFLLAAVLAYVMSPLVSLLERRDVSRTGAILLVYLMVGVAGFLLAVGVVPQLIQEAEGMVERLPQERLQGLVDRTVREFDRVRLPPALEEFLQNLLGRLEEALEAFALRLAELLLGVFGRAFSLILAPVLAFYLLRDWERLRAAALDRLPPPQRGEILALTDEINQVLHNFIRGQLLISLVVAGLTTLGLTLLGVRYALLVGVIAGLFDIIPYFGAVIGSVPGVALALLESPATALWVVLMFVLIHQFEGTILAPKIMGDYVRLHPAAVIFALLAGLELMGIIGMLLGVPVLAAGRVIARFAGRRLVAGRD